MAEEDASELVLGAATDDLRPHAEKPDQLAPPRDHAPSTGRSAALVTAGIILSRLVRQRVTAHYFGTSIFADVLTAAFRVGNITQNLLGEGTLSATFIPVYAKLRAEGRSREATHFALSALGLLSAAALIASALGTLLAPWLTFAIAAGYDAERLESTIHVVRIVFPMTGLLVVSALGLGVLNAHRRFFLPYAAPVVWSLAQIVGVLIAGAIFDMRGETLAIALTLSALVGAGFQLFVLLPAAKTLLGGSLKPRFDTKDAAVREAAKRLPGALLGRGVIQISSLVDTFLVSFLGPGANAAFGYAQNIYLLPLALLGTGEAAAALPEMASDSAEEDLVRRNALLQRRLGASLTRITILAVPAMLVFIFLGNELITVLLQSGSFNREATTRVQPLLAAYSLALLGNAFGRVLTTTTYALGDTKTPARYAVYRLIASAAGSLALMQTLDVMGVVLGTVLAAWVEFVALALYLRKKIGGIGLGQIPRAKVFVLGVASIGPALLLRNALPEDFVASSLGGMLLLSVSGASFAVAAPLLGLITLRSLLRGRARAA